MGGELRCTTEATVPGQSVSLSGTITVKRVPVKNLDIAFALDHLQTFLEERYPFDTSGVDPHQVLCSRRGNTLAVRLPVTFGGEPVYIDAILFEPTRNRITKSLGWKISLPEHPALSEKDKKLISEILNALNVPLSEGIPPHALATVRPLEKMGRIGAKMGFPSAVASLTGRYLDGDPAVTELLKREPSILRRISMQALRAKDPVQLTRALVRLEEDGLLTRCSDLIARTASEEFNSALGLFLLNLPMDRLEALIISTPSLLEEVTPVKGLPLGARAKRQRNLNLENGGNEPSEALGFLCKKQGFLPKKMAVETLRGYMRAFSAELPVTEVQARELKTDLVWVCNCALELGVMADTLKENPFLVDQIGRAELDELVREDPRMEQQGVAVIDAIGVSKAKRILSPHLLLHSLQGEELTEYVKTVPYTSKLIDALSKCDRPEVFQALAERCTFPSDFRPSNLYSGLQPELKEVALGLRIARETLFAVTQNDGNTALFKPLYERLCRAWGVLEGNEHFLIHARGNVPPGDIFANLSGAFLGLSMLGYEGATTRLDLIRRFFGVEEPSISITLVPNLLRGQAEIFTSRRDPVGTGARLIVAILGEEQMNPEAVAHYAFHGALQSLQHPDRDASHVFREAVLELEKSGRLTPPNAAGVLIAISRFFRFEDLVAPISTDATNHALQKLVPCVDQWLKEASENDPSKQAVAAAAEVIYFRVGVALGERRRHAESRG